MNDKGQSLDTTKNEQMLELFEKEYKTAIIKCFSEQLYTHLKQVKIKKAYAEKQSLRKDIEKEPNGKIP